MFCSYRISTDKLSRGPSAIAEPLVVIMQIAEICIFKRICGKIFLVYNQVLKYRLLIHTSKTAKKLK